MARRRNPDIRARLRDQAVDYVVAHGLQDLALRPLAKALHTNARMLVYHFGSRAGLMRQILAGLRERGDAAVEAWFQPGETTRTLPEFLRWYWKQVSEPQVRPAVRLIFELYALALRHPKDYPGVLEDPLDYWKKLTVKAGMPSKLDAVEATLLLAATRGLLLDLCATGDRPRVGRALRHLARLVEPSLTPPRRPRHRHRRLPGRGGEGLPGR